jgi:hypothetical protein
MAVSPDLDDARSRISATVTTRRKMLHDVGHRVPSASVTAGLGEYGQWLDYAHDRASQSDRRGMPVRPDTIEMALFDGRTLFVMRVLLASHYQERPDSPPDCDGPDSDVVTSETVTDRRCGLS